MCASLIEFKSDGIHHLSSECSDGRHPVPNNFPSHTIIDIAKNDIIKCVLYVPIEGICKDVQKTHAESTTSIDLYTLKGLCNECTASLGVVSDDCLFTNLAERRWCH